jgi:hypothetical protein
MGKFKEEPSVKFITDFLPNMVKVQKEVGS